MSEEIPTPQQEEALKVVILDQSHDAYDEARDRADIRLTQELNEGGRFKQFVNGIWKGNVARDYYRQKYIHQELDTIQSANNVLADEPASRRTRALEATISRFQGDYDELIHTEAGERREIQEQTPLADGVKQLIRDFAEGKLNAATLHEERTRLLNDYRAAHGVEAAGKGLVTTDNLLEIAQAVVGAVEHGESLDNSLSRLQVITGEARTGVRTEASYTAVDTVIEKLSRHKITSLVTPGALAVGVAAAASIARVGSHSVVGAVTKTLLPGIAAGAWAGLRENKRVKDERVQHAREMAVGGMYQEGDKRRIEMEATRYESIAAIDLVSTLQSVNDETQLRDGGEEALQAALDALAAVQARVQLSDSKRIDLISYSDKAAVGEERLMLDLARAETRRAIEAGMTEDIRASLGLSDERTFAHILDERSALLAEVISGELTAKDEAFMKLKRRRVASAAAVGVATGVVGGLIVQEAVAAFDPTRLGLIDAIRGESATPLEDGSVHQTVLEGIVRGDETVIHSDASTNYEAYDTKSNGSIKLSDDHELITNEDGTLDLKDANGETTVKGLVINEDGTLDQESLSKLESAGMTVEDASFDETIATTTSMTVTTEQYLQNHSSETTKVTRDFWYSNDTPGVYDENEVRLYKAGSTDQPGLTENGYQYTLAGMRPDGSWQGGESVDWSQAATNGNLFVAISGTLDSQGTPFMVPIGPDGTINISADSPAGQFFANENNGATFNGAYMEVVQTAGVDADGTVHIRPLATLVGDRSVTEIVDQVTTETVKHHAEYVITTNGYDTIRSNFTEMAPITPVTSRRSMEGLLKPTVDRMKAAEYRRGEASEVERARIIAEVSPRLKESPDTKLSPKEELEWFRYELVRRKGEAYVAEMEAFIQNSPELSALSPSTESIVVMPVRGASESENIYRTLSLFAQQEREQDKDTTILINLNWLDTVISNPEDAAAIQKTASEIERAKRDFPQLSIAVMQKEYEQAETKKTGGALGYIADDLINVSLLALNKKIVANQIPGDHDILIIRSDADVNGISRKQLSNFEKAARENEGLDVIKGLTRFGVEDQRNFPGFGIATNFSSAIAVTGAQENIIHTGGANFGVRASTLAAVNGLGDLGWTGVASDDVEIGWRITVARGLGVGASGYGRSANGSGDGVGRRRVKVITGASIDTNADRLLPFYIKGRSFQDAWSDPGEGFSSGDEEYELRTSGKNSMAKVERERFTSDKSYASLEANIRQELAYAPTERAGRRALALFFAGVPGAYTLAGKIGEESVQFKLTNAGRKFIKDRVERESNGRFGSYGLRKMRQLYGVTSANAKRQPGARVAPLVSPLT